MCELGNSYHVPDGTALKGLAANARAASAADKMQIHAARPVSPARAMRVTITALPGQIHPRVPRYPGTASCVRSALRLCDLTRQAIRVIRIEP
jgi:hypothetical protein